jgi:hypothetical protein
MNTEERSRKWREDCHELEYASLGPLKSDGDGPKASGTEPANLTMTRTARDCVPNEGYSVLRDVKWS